MKKDNTNYTLGSVIFALITSVMIGQRISSWLINHLMTVSTDISNIYRTPFGYTILTSVSVCFFFALILNVYRYICCIREDNTLKNALFMTYHAAVFSTVLNISKADGLYAILVLVIVAVSYLMHLEGDDDHYYTRTAVKTLVYSAICYGAAVCNILIALCSEYISNIRATGVLLFFLLSVLSFLALFVKAATDSILYKAE